MLKFIKSQYTPIPYPTTTFTGNTVIVTGSNTGLGLEAARHFVRLDATKVILACRSISKGEDAKKSIEESEGREGVCEVWQVDMDNFDSVKDFCQRAQRLDRLDIVCENAGILTDTFTETEGMEQTIAVNVVGTFLMALNLFPVMRASGQLTGVVPRLVITASEVHEWSQMAERHEPSIFGALKKNDATYMADRYNTSKLLEVFVVRSLAREMQSGPHGNQPIVLNCVTPGLCHSNLSRGSKGLKSAFFTCLKFVLARRTDVGALTLIWGATGDDKSHGQYWANAKISPPSEFVTSEEGRKTQERVYSELMGILENIQPGISRNI